jgi:hypothetical protein
LLENYKFKKEKTKKEERREVKRGGRDKEKESARKYVNLNLSSYK